MTSHVHPTVLPDGFDIKVLRNGGTYMVTNPAGVAAGTYIIRITDGVDSTGVKRIVQELINVETGGVLTSARSSTGFTDPATIGGVHPTWSASFYKQVAIGQSPTLVYADYLDILATTLGTPDVTTGLFALAAGPYLVTLETTSSATNTAVTFNFGDHQVEHFEVAQRDTLAFVVPAAGNFSIAVSNGSGAQFDAAGLITLVQL